MEVVDFHQVDTNFFNDREIKNTKPFHQKGEIIIYNLVVVLKKGIQQSELIILRHAMASKTHLEALAEKAKRTTERRVRQP